MVTLDLPTTGGWTLASRAGATAGWAVEAFMYSDRSLTGFAPRYTHLDVDLDPDGYVEVRVWQGDAVGFKHRSQAAVYDRLTAGEAFDVLVAVLDGLGLWGELEEA